MENSFLEQIWTFFSHFSYQRECCIHTVKMKYHLVSYERNVELYCDLILFTYIINRLLTFPMGTNHFCCFHHTICFACCYFDIFCYFFLNRFLLHVIRKLTALKSLFTRNIESHFFCIEYTFCVRVFVWASCEMIHLNKQMKICFYKMFYSVGWIYDFYRNWKHGIALSSRFDFRHVSNCCLFTFYALLINDCHRLSIVTRAPRIKQRVILAKGAFVFQLFDFV